MTTRTPRLLVVADTADGWPTDSEGRRDLTALVQTSRADALISLGDFSGIHAGIMARAGAPLTAGVYGNHCTDDYMPETGIIDLVGDRSKPARRGTLHLPGHGPITVLAVQGCVRYKDRGEDVLFTQDQYAAAIDSLPAADLVITHCPPTGINDGEDYAHQGIDALRAWVDRHQPQWLLHGHTYQNPARSLHGATTVHWVSGCAVIDL